MRNWILRDQSDDHLIEAIERNSIEHMLFFASRHPEMYVAVKDDFIVVNTKIASHFFNYVCASRFIPENIESRIQKTIEYFKGKDLPFSWVVGPTMPQDMLSDVLTKLGLEKTEQNHCMLLNLHGFRKKARYIPGFRIQQALTKSSIQDVGKVYANGSSNKEHIEKYFAKVSKLAFHGSDPIQLFVGYIDEVPAVVGELYLGAGIAGFKCFVAEQFEDRNKELITDLTIKMLLKAREQSYHFAVAKSFKEQCLIYKQLGFKKYCEFSRFQ
ncbi:MAG: hypothetical protein S4CHLAM37_14760 [Chlamydiia bacterium]|nr:hypothetical protein [Chlamydiia bacterium]